LIDPLKDIRAWFGIAERDQRETTKRLREANRIIKDLVKENIDLAAEVERLRKENETLRRGS
jgi:cell division protein FtsB